MIVWMCIVIHGQFYLFGPESRLNDIAEVITVKLLHGIHKQSVQQFFLFLLQATLLFR